MRRRVIFEVTSYIYIPGGLRTGRFWTLDITDACHHADGFSRDVFPRAPRGWDSENTRRIWSLGEPAFGLNGAPVAFRRFSRKHQEIPADPPATVGLEFGVSSSGP